MKIFTKLLFQEFLFGGHLLSLGAGAIVWSVLILSGNGLSLTIFALAYLCSQIVYNYDHLDDLVKPKANSERTKYLRKTRKLQYSMLIFYLIAFIYLVFQTTLPSTILAVSITFSGILYTKYAKNLTKNIPAFKNIYIAFFWAILVFFVPFHLKIDINEKFTVLFMFVFFRWIINSSFFDIKDTDEDRVKKLKTLPVYFGLHRTIMLLHVVNVISGLVVLSAVVLNFLPVYGLILMITPFYSFYYLSIVETLSSKKLKLISYVMVDGEYLLWPFLLLIGSLLLN